MPRASLFVCLALLAGCSSPRPDDAPRRGEAEYAVVEAARACGAESVVVRRVERADRREIVVWVTYRRAPECTPFDEVWVARRQGRRWAVLPWRRCNSECGWWPGKALGRPRPCR